MKLNKCYIIFFKKAYTMDIKHEIINLLPTTTYVAKVKIKDKKAELLSFELLKSGHYTQYEKEDFNKDLCLSNLPKEDYDNLMKNLPSLIKQNTFSIKYKFIDKNGKYHFFKDIVKVIEQKDDVYTLLGIGIDITKEEELAQIYNTLQNSPHIGVLIYRDKFLYLNDTTCKILEADKNTCYNLKPHEVIPDKYKKELFQIINDRLSGKFFFHFLEAETPSLKGTRKHLNFLSQTIVYNREYAGFLLIIDKTKEVKHQLLLTLISDINRVIKDSKDELSLLKNCVNTIKKSKLFINAILNFNNKPIKTPKNAKSQIILPIYFEDKHFADIVIFSQYKDDFDTYTTKVLNEIKTTIEESIKNITKTNILNILKEAIEKSYQWVVITDKDGNILFANDIVSEISGYSQEELLGENPRIFQSGIHNTSFYENLWKTILSGKTFESEIVNKNKFNKHFYLKTKIIPVKINKDYYFVALGMDITKQKELELALTDLKQQDPLTQLLNRDAFLEKSNDLINDFPNQKFAMILIDLKDFKIINKLKGSKFGDLILQYVAKILKEKFEEYIQARIGNDEFALFVPFNQENEVIALAQQIIENIKTLSIKDISLSANIGISYYNQHALTPKKLLESASAALHMAKKTENTIEIYDPSLYQNFSKYFKTKQIIQDALQKDNFEFFFQPYYSYTQKKFIGAEALLRIKGNTEIKTEEFIKYAEKSRIIKQIELQSLKNLAKIIKEIKFPISFNISPVSLSDKEHMQKIIKIFKGIEKYITIEITERLLLKDSFEIFNTLKEKGFKIAIDDFGSGYASFKYLKNLLADIIKVDKEFIENITHSTNDKKIVDIILDFAQKFNMDVISEGVETKEQELILSTLGCDIFQGYYYSKPIPLKDFKNLIKNS